MPNHDLFQAQIATTLDDLLQRRNEAFPAIKPETLGALELHIQKALEAFRLDQFGEDGALAFAGECNFLVRPSMRS